MSERSQVDLVLFRFASFFKKPMVSLFWIELNVARDVQDAESEQTVAALTMGSFHPRHIARERHHKPNHDLGPVQSAL